MGRYLRAETMYSSIFLYLLYIRSFKTGLKLEILFLAKVVKRM
ncbi:hypothetical protein HMPREF9296_0308 [Prevotella disiens FB035-09AN]|uniref:Uncharacterized protein n=1 Tax=Prevotella disiens FB035-09AN TaxID=866771 RepID=E1KMN6_9BACT|nr:hypothetical protein HMPREF9296_0308 [Prevotella disiens FB035-09AN]